MMEIEDAYTEKKLRSDKLTDRKANCQEGRVLELSRMYLLTTDFPLLRLLKTILSMPPGSNLCIPYFGLSVGSAAPP